MSTPPQFAEVEEPGPLTLQESRQLVDLTRRYLKDYDVDSEEETVDQMLGRLFDAIDSAHDDW